MFSIFLVKYLLQWIVLCFGTRHIYFSASNIYSFVHSGRTFLRRIEACAMYGPCNTFMNEYNKNNIINHQLSLLSARTITLTLLTMFSTDISLWQNKIFLVCHNVFNLERWNFSMGKQFLKMETIKYKTDPLNASPQFGMSRFTGFYESICHTWSFQLNADWIL